MNTSADQCFWPGWETVGLIGRGSFGAVYEIQRDVFGEVEKAALKVISIPQNSSDIEELYGEGYDEESITSTFKSHLKSIIAEYSLMRKMSDSVNIVNCEDVRYIQHEDGIGWDIFIKMELLTPLTKSLSGNITEETVVKLGVDMCRALEMCGEYDIVHRDIKPQNIFISSKGDYKLGDFGIAKTVEKTMCGTKIGTYKYMAPEVYNNQPYGAGADIYSLGLVLYWLLNERRMPFLPLPPEKLKAGMDDEARHRRLQGEQLPQPAHGSDALKAVVLKACAYNPAERFGSAQEMRLALDAVLRGDQDAEIEKLKREQEEKERLRREQEEQERLKREKEESERLRIESEEQTRLKKEQEEQERIRREKERQEQQHKDQEKKKDSESEQKNASSKKKSAGWILAAASLLIIAVGAMLIPKNTTEVKESPFNASGEASGEAFYVESLDGGQHAHCAVYTWGGAVIDEAGYLWLWDSSTMIAENTGVGNLKAIAQSADSTSRVYFLNNDGQVGYVVAGEIGIMDSFTGVEDPVWLDSPEAIVYVVANGGGCYAVDTIGRVFHYNYDDELFLHEDIVAFENLQCVELGLFGKATDGNYYAFGNDVFGIYTQNSGASNEISSPERLFDGTNLEDVRVFRVLGESSAMFAKLYAGQNLHVYDNAGQEICALSECMTLYSGGCALYAVDFYGNLYAYGYHASGAPLNSNTSVYTGTPSSFFIAEGLGIGLRSIGIGGWDVALVYEDGSVRTWGQDQPDCYITDGTGNMYFLNYDE